MQQNQIISIEIDPMGAPRMSQRDRWTNVEAGKGRPVVLRYFAYRDKLNEALPGYKLPQRLSLTYFIPMPKSWTKHKRSLMAGSPHASKPDADNLAKGFMDAFKVEGQDDRHVAVLHVEKYWSYQGSIEVGEYPA